MTTGPRTGGLALPIRVLFLEDESDIRELVLSLFDPAEFAFAFASTELEALARLHDDPCVFDAGIIDLHLDGTVVGTRVFDALRRKRVAIVISSGIEPEVAGPIAADERATSYLRKPLDAADLREAILSAAKRSAELRRWDTNTPSRAAARPLRASDPSVRARPRSTRSVVLDGMRIQRVRRSRGWTQENLAERAGLDTKTVRVAEAGRRVSLSTLRALAKALQLPAHVLGGGDLRR